MLQATMGVIRQEIQEGIDKTILKKCPKCKVGDLVTIMVCDNKGPPPKYSYLLTNTNFNIIH